MSHRKKPILKTLARADWGMWLGGMYDYNVRSRFQPLPPKLFQLVTNYRCNSRCIMCNIWQMPNRHELTVDEFTSIMDPDPIFDGIEQINVSGGEIFLRSDLVELTGYLLKRLPNLSTFSMVSNGFLPRRILAQTEAILQLLEARHVRLSMSISLDGVGTMHDEVRGISGAFEKAQETIDCLQVLQKQHDFWLGSGFVVMHQNLHLAREFAEWATARHLDYGFQLVGFNASYVGNLDTQENIDFRPEDRLALISLMQDQAGERSLTNPHAYYWNDMVRMYRDGAQRTTPCPFAVDGLALDAYGDVYYCLTTPKIGNVLAEKRSVGAIYYDPANLHYRAQDMRRGVCLKCSSACGTETALKKDFTKFVKFLVAGS